MDKSRKIIYLDESGFTLLEMVMVIVIIGLLFAAASQRMVNIAEDAEIQAEDATIEVMRNNILTNYSEALVRDRVATFPNNPFANLTKIPEGYDRRRTTRPTGQPQDDGLWVFVGGTANSSVNLTPEQAGTTLTTFRGTGVIYHQREDHTIVRWVYDRVNGVISSKIIDRESPLKRQLDADRRLRGEETERDRLRRRQRGSAGANQPSGASGTAQTTAP